MTQELMPSGEVVAGNFNTQGGWEVYIDYNDDKNADVHVVATYPEEGMNIEVNIVDGEIGPDEVMQKLVKDEDNGISFMLYDEEQEDSELEYKLFYDTGDPATGNIIINKASKDFGSGTTEFVEIFSDLNESNSGIFVPLQTIVSDFNSNMFSILPSELLSILEDMEKEEEQDQIPQKQGVTR